MRDLGCDPLRVAVTALILLGLWLFAFPVGFWGTSGGIWSTTTRGRANIAIYACSHPLTPRLNHRVRV